MIKSALKIYIKNIWDLFALIGFVAIGITIGLLITIPQLYTLTTSEINDIVKSVENTHINSFNSDVFMNTLIKTFTAMDWANPIRTIQELFQGNNLLNIIMNSLKSAGLDPASFTRVKEVAIVSCKNIVNGFNNQVIIFISSVGLGAMIGYILTKIVIQIRSTSNHNIFKFILSFVFNILNLCLIYYLLIYVILNVNGPWLYVSLIGVFLLQLLLTLFISIVLYKRKGIKFTKLFNVKNFFGLLLSSIIVFALSLILIIVVFIFSDLIALIIALPLLLVTDLIVENIVIAYVTNYKEEEPKNIVAVEQK